MSAERLAIIRAAAHKQKICFRVLDRKGLWLRSFRYVFDALAYNTATPYACRVVNATTGKALTRDKGVQISESAIDRVLERASRARGGRTVAEDVEIFLPDVGEVASDDDKEAA